jgi:hypothetical protein
LERERERERERNERCDNVRGREEGRDGTEKPAL